MIYKNNLLKVFKRLPKQILVLQIDKAWVKLALIEKADMYLINKVVVKELPEKMRGEAFFSNQNTADFLRILLAENNLQDTKHIIVTLGYENSVVKYFTLPEMDRKQLSDAVKWELLEYDIEDNEYYFDFLVNQGKFDDADEQGVVVAAAKKTFVDGALKLCDKMRLNLLGVTVSAFSGAAAVQNVEQNYILLDISEKFCHITACNNSLPVYSAAYEFIDENSCLDDSYGYLMNVLRQNDVNFTKIIVAGNAANNFMNVYGDTEFNGLPSLEKITLPESISWGGKFLSRAELAAVAENYYTLIGAVIGETNVNLLPDSKNYQAKLYKYAAYVWLVATIIISVYSFSVNEISKSKLASAQGELAALSEWQERYENLEQLKHETDTLNVVTAKLEKNAVKWSDILIDLGMNTPQNCYINRIRQEENHKTVIEIDGVADNMEAVTQFISALKQSGKFKQVDLNKTETKNNGIAYSILLQAKGGEK